MRHTPMHEVLGITKAEYVALCEIRDELRREEHPDFKMTDPCKCFMGIARLKKGNDMRPYTWTHHEQFNQNVHDLFYPDIDAGRTGGYLVNQKQGAERLDRYLTTGRADF